MGRADRVSCGGGASCSSPPFPLVAPTGIGPWGERRGLSREEGSGESSGENRVHEERVQERRGFSRKEGSVEEGSGGRERRERAASTWSSRTHANMHLCSHPTPYTLHPRVCVRVRVCVCVCVCVRV